MLRKTLPLVAFQPCRQAWTARIPQRYFVTWLLRLVDSSPSHSHLPLFPHKDKLGIVSQGLSRGYVKDQFGLLEGALSHSWNEIYAFGGSLLSCSSCWALPHAILSQHLRIESRLSHLHILLQVCCLFAGSGWGRGGGKLRVIGKLSAQLGSSAVGSIPVGATRDRGLCLLFLASSEVMSVAEDTGAVARSPAGAGTV